MSTDLFHTSLKEPDHLEAGKSGTDMPQQQYDHFFAPT